MIFTSPRPPLDIPKKDILSYMFDDWQHGWDKPVFVDADDPSQIITAEQLVNLTRRIGRGLRESVGVRPGDVVLMSATNSIIIPPLILGILCSGATLSGASPRFTQSELSYQIKDTGAKAIFAVQETLDLVLNCVDALGLPRSMVYLITLEKSSEKGVRTLGNLLDFGEMDWERLTTEEAMRSRIAALNYSSGTTGLPKGCMITVYNIVAHCEQQRQVHDISRQVLRERGEDMPDTDAVICFLPFYHAFGQQQYVFNAARNGDTTYVMPSFSFEALLRYIPKYKITTFAAVPPVAVLLAKHPDVRNTDFSSVHSILCGAAPLGKETQLQAEAAMNTYKKGRVQISQGWGMSEGVCGSCNFMLYERDPDVSGVGYLLSGMSARIVPADGSDYSKSLGFNEEGEILLKGPQIFPGYWRKEKETREAFTEDGWYKTGDVGIMKRNGIMHIVDRKKELIKVKAFQVAPAELEDMLLKSPDVEDAAVIGIPGEGTEHPRAYIVPSPSRQSTNPEVLRALANDILTFSARHSASYKHLTGGIVFVDIIPKNPSGKILRRQLRDRARAKDCNDKVWLSEERGKIRARL
ncbi:acetyl-CoA synthetase-like protein [Fomitiporia mediterranea MF3/22]|uniref:acetyl-CoA synthetase-like protein n=1 Tax=Fomitiporia mediterranea (strain MF3/22) TaxID=694068 RepID=UPI0004407DEE|nr:acetyl-CoA synthetase-like protein [Fomitiporia mediterranea MF3/22]EJD02554.1 acetyl-CoA synthetase-like protein [Fomitiporia mediterranea MF3/22]